MNLHFTVQQTGDQPYPPSLATQPKQIQVQSTRKTIIMYVVWIIPMKNHYKVCSMHRTYGECKKTIIKYIVHIVPMGFL